MIYNWSSKLDFMGIGDRVQKARAYAGLNKTQLAKLCGMSKQAIGQIETGTTKQPTPTNLFKIAKATGTRADWIATGEGAMVNSDSYPPQALIQVSQEIREPGTGIGHAPNYHDDNDRQGSVQIRSVPVFSSKEIIQGNPDGAEKEYIYAPATQVSASAFSYAVREISTPNDRFGIDQDMYIIIDPEADWQNGKLLLIKDSNGNLIIRRYEVVGSKRYLAPFNERYDPIELDDQFVVIGRIVGRYAHD